MTYNRERYNATQAPGAAALDALSGWLAFKAWLQKQLFAIQRSMPWAPYVDARDFIVSAEGADVTTELSKALSAAAGGTLLFPPRIYRTASNFTFPSTVHLKFSLGATLQPQAGVTTTITGSVDAGPWQIFDFSALGLISFSGNKSIHEYLPQWFGVKGDGATDDSATLLAMTNAIPDWSTVRFSRGMQIKLNYVWPIVGRQGLKFTCDVFPTDAYLTAGTGVGFLWGGITDGVMIGSYNNGYCIFEGFVMDLGAAKVGIDHDGTFMKVTNGSAAVQTQGRQLASGTTGASFLKSLAPNIPIKLTGAGTGSTTLSTTVLSVADDTHLTLATNCLTSTSGSVPSFGFNAPSPNGRIPTQCKFQYTQIFANALNAKNQTCLRCNFSNGTNNEYNVFRYLQLTGQQGINFNVPQAGGSLQRAIFNSPVGFSAPGGALASGSNQYKGFTVDTFSVSMDGAFIQIDAAGTANAGARGGTGPLVGYMKYISARRADVYSDAGLTTPLNSPTGHAAAYNGATTYVIGDVVISSDTLYRCILGTTGNAPPNVTYWAVDSRHFTIGQNNGTGLYFGANFNTKRELLENCEIRNLNIGINCTGGSMHQMFTNFSDNDVNVVMGVTQSEPSSEYGTNSEDGRSHLIHGSPQPYTILNSRIANLYVAPGLGVMRFVAGSGGVLRVAFTQFEGAMQGRAAMYSSRDFAGVVVSEQNRYANMLTLDDLGWSETALTNGAIVKSVGDTSPDLAALLNHIERIYANEQTGRYNGQPLRYMTGMTFFANEGAPIDADFPLHQGWAWFGNTGAQGERPSVKYMKVDHSRSLTFSPTINGKIALTDGATVTPDLTAGDYFVLVAGGSRTLASFGSNWVQGQFVTFHIYNASGGAMTTTWNGIYHLAGAWVDPANAKARLITFRVLDGVAYEQSRTAADVS